MPKFYIHVFQKERIKFEVEAESSEAAAGMVDDILFGHGGKEIERELTGDFDEYVLVDPVKEDGSIDYENSKWYPEDGA